MDVPDFPIFQLNNSGFFPDNVGLPPFPYKHLVDHLYIRSS